MSFDFPSSPTTGQTFTPAGGPAYQWNGYAWTTGAPVAPLGTQVGSAYAELTTLAVTATAMAGAITTVPQQTDGLQFLSVTITPKSVSNKLRFNITSPVSSGSSTAAWMAVFQDSTAAAIASVFFHTQASELGMVVALAFDVAANTIASTTFKLRFGNTQGNANNIRLTGDSGGQRGGGSQRAVVQITEIAA